MPHLSLGVSLGLTSQGCCWGGCCKNTWMSRMLPPQVTVLSPPPLFPIPYVLGA